MGELLHILIVDDSAADALLLQRALRKGGLEVDSTRVDNAEAMLEAMAGQRWDVAISDCHMPEFTPEGALNIWKEAGGDQPFIIASGAIGEQEAVALLKAGAHDFVRKDNLARLVTAIERELRETGERRARRKAEEALRDSEQRRLRLRAELACAAKVQQQLLPTNVLTAPGFDFAARCFPAHQIGGDFYDWHEMVPGTITLTLGDAMGKGMAAAMMMATVRAALRAVDQSNSPAVALQLTECALIHDLSSSDSFVTLFHAQLNLASRKLVYVDCGHGFAFLRRADGRKEELLPRGLPLGVLSDEIYQEGEFTFEQGDALVLYSDGLIDALPEQALDNEALAEVLDGAKSAEEMVERLTALVPPEDTIPDDLTVVVLRCQKES
ncbi:MAG: SpoIIE family protein phosphatase [Proteobacteria bacterium]|nr:SpoIIE family protein phosphatase [Pseudomonadota bacterium]